MMRKNPLKQDQKNLVSNAEKYLDDLQSVSMIYKVSGLTESVRLVYLIVVWMIWKISRLSLKCALFCKYIFCQT